MYEVRGSQTRPTLDGIRCHRERDYAPLSKSPLSPSPPLPSSFFHSPSLSLASPHPHDTTFLLRRCTAISPLYTRLSSPPLRTKRLSRNPRSFPALFYEQPLWHRREPALISHLPLFFISDIRIYHRDPAATPLEGQREEEGEEGMETNRGPRGEGEDSVEKRWRGAPTIIGRVGLPRSLTIIDPHSPRRREWIQTLSISYYAFLLYLSLPPLAPKRWRKLYRCASLI